MKTILSWSSGKDSAWALHELKRTPDIEVAGLLTVLSEATDRVTMHSTHRALVEAQARAAGLPLHVVTIPAPCPNVIYEQRMASVVAGFRANGVEAVAFGDLFLEDIRAYREARLAGTGIAPLFPIWQRDTRAVAGMMIEAGLKARIVSVDPSRLPSTMLGRNFDRAFLDMLPAPVDPCGENGEFHTFCTDGPMFSRPIAVTDGKTGERDGLLVAELNLEQA